MKLIALNSGGFDSVVMLNFLRHQYPLADIHCIHFNYGQNSKEQELKCAESSCNKLSAHLQVIDLPTMSWTSSNFYGEDFKSMSTQELEYRNLIFLSYAVSYATSVGADKVYVAFLRADEYYKDTSPKFVREFNKFSKKQGVEVIAPFHKLYKDELSLLIKKFDIKEDDFFSCDTPVDGKPCGVCPDCMCLHDMFVGK